MHKAILPIVVLISPAAAVAQDAAPSLDAVIKCRDEAARDARLACFDRSVAALDRARSEKRVLVLDRGAVVARKQRQFGLSSSLGGPIDGSDTDRQTAVVDLDSTIRRAAPTAAMPGRWNLTLANGMIWQTLENLARTPVPGTAIKLRRASLGGYRASIGMQSRGISVKRVR